MAEAVYILCALTSLVCAVLLVRAWRASRSRLLFWSSVCFIGLFLNNATVVVDEILTSDAISLIWLRDLTNTGSVCALVIGLVWGSSR